MWSMIIILACWLSTITAAQSTFWTDDPDRLAIVDTKALLDNFANDTRSISSDGNGLRLTGVYFHLNYTFSSTEQDDPQTEEENTAATINPRDPKPVVCKISQCFNAPPRYLTPTQIQFLAGKLCPLFVTDTHSHGAATIFATNGVCNGRKKCDMIAQADFDFAGSSPKAIVGLEGDCHRASAGIKAHCGKHGGVHECHAEGDGKFHVAYGYEALPNDKSINCQYSASTMCKMVKCNTYNSDCQT